MTTSDIRRHEELVFWHDIAEAVDLLDGEPTQSQIVRLQAVLDTLPMPSPDDRSLERFRRAVMGYVLTVWLASLQQPPEGNSRRTSSVRAAVGDKLGA